MPSATTQLRAIGWTGAAVLGAGFLVAPLVGSNYHLHAAIMSMIFLYPALGLNLILGYTGMLSLAQGAFFGIGAYTSALLAMQFATPFWLNFLAAGLVCAVIALPLAVPSLRLRRYSFVMCTLAFVVIGEAVSKNWISLTRGDMGLSGVPRPVLGLWTDGVVVSQVTHYYFLALGLAVVGTAALYWLVTSPAGRCMVAIRDDETLAESLGVPVWRYKLIVFALSAMFAGMGGSLYAHYMTVVSPLIFQMYYSHTILIIVFGGGAGTIGGVLLGTFLFVAVSEALRIAPELRMILYGLLLLVLVFRFPNGLGPLLLHIAARVAARVRGEQRPLLVR
jgi:branched-chain amino acid transport system permease protein